MNIASLAEVTTANHDTTRTSCHSVVNVLDFHPANPALSLAVAHGGIRKERHPAKTAPVHRKSLLHTWAHGVFIKGFHEALWLISKYWWCLASDSLSYRTAATTVYSHQYCCHRWHFSCWAWIRFVWWGTKHRM